MWLDYAMLRMLCWGILVLFIIGFSLAGGIELGVSILMPVLGLSPEQQRSLTRRLAVISLGNQVWLMAVVAVLFAGWPTVFAAMFFSFQTLWLMLILALCVRPFACYFRAYCSPAYLPKWDKALFVSGLVAAAILGVMAGSLLKGFPFHLNSDMRIAFLGTLGGLLNPFALLSAVISVSLLACLGGLYLQLISEDQVYQRSKEWVMSSGLVFLVAFGLAGLWITRLEGYHVNTEIMPGGVSNPLIKFVNRGEGLWLDNYEHIPSLWSIPVLSVCGGIAMLLLSRRDRRYGAMLAGAVTVTMVVLTVAVSMFPFLAASNISLNSSLTLWDASASQVTLSGLVWLSAAALVVMAVSTRGLFRLLRAGIADTEA